MCFEGKLDHSFVNDVLDREIKIHVRGVSRFAARRLVNLVILLVTCFGDWSILLDLNKIIQKCYFNALCNFAILRDVRHRQHDQSQTGYFKTKENTPK